MKMIDRRLGVKSTERILLMFSRYKLLIEIPSYLNMFDVDKLHFEQTSDGWICMKF